VFRARHDHDPYTDVALKVLRPGFENRRLLARFDLETHALSMLHHPNIARLLNAGVLPDRRPYFSMEMVHGQPITEYCTARSAGRRAALELFIVVCAAVEHAHIRGIIHRDLKPANILVTDIDGQPDPKVIDFCVAKIVQGNSPARWQTNSRGHIIGTLEYMSPEQCAGSVSGLDTRADVYALGVLLHELLTGTRPFTWMTCPLRKRCAESLSSRHLRSRSKTRPWPATSRRLSVTRWGKIGSAAIRARVNWRTTCACFSIIVPSAPAAAARSTSFASTPPGINPS